MASSRLIVRLLPGLRHAGTTVNVLEIFPFHS